MGEWKKIMSVIIISIIVIVHVLFVIIAPRALLFLYAWIGVGVWGFFAIGFHLLSIGLNTIKGVKHG